MTADKGYLVVVADGVEDDSAPDMSSLRVFEASSGQGVSYHPGVWHHPLIALDSETDFGCAVWEDGTDDDCDVVELEDSARIYFVARGIDS